jgi:iron complex outermembrane recepter protein
MIAPGVSFGDRQFDRSPSYTFLIGNTFTTTLWTGGELSASLRFRQSDEYKLLSSTLRAQFTQPSYHKTDFDLTYTGQQGNWYVQAFVQNIEDEITIQSVSASGYCAAGRQRQQQWRAGIQ